MYSLLAKTICVCPFCFLYQEKLLKLSCMCNNYLTLRLFLLPSRLLCLLVRGGTCPLGPYRLIAYGWLEIWKQESLLKMTFFFIKITFKFMKNNLSFKLQFLFPNFFWQNQLFHLSKIHIFIWIQKFVLTIRFRRRRKDRKTTWESEGKTDRQKDSLTIKRTEMLTEWETDR